MNNIAKTRSSMERLRALLAIQGRGGMHEKQAVQVEMGNIKSQIDKELGRLNGWKGSDNPFSKPGLVRAKSHDGPDDYREMWGAYEGHCSVHDHRTFYRLGRMPVCVVAHPYGNRADVIEQCTIWARRYGLICHASEFESWWYPGRTVAVAYTRIGDDLIWPDTGRPAPALAEAE